MDAFAGLQTGLIGYGLTILVAMAAAGLIWLIVRVLDAMKKGEAAASSVGKPVAVAVQPQAPAVDETAHHVAVIAAAIYAVLGAHRLVYIGEAPASSYAWTTTGRAIHQTSHTPKHAPKR